MGTNYYLIKKCTRQTFEEFCEYNDDFNGGDDFRKLQNGFVYKNKFYASDEELNSDLALTLHIGKSSYGWHFSLCVYPALGINNLSDWKKLFAISNIYDEYNKLISTDEMLSIITERKMQDWSEENAAQQEEHAIEGFNATCEALGQRLRVLSYDEYLRANNARRGKNGLLAHSGIHVTNTDGTYDLTTEWRFC